MCWGGCRVGDGWWIDFIDIDDLEFEDDLIRYTVRGFYRISV